MRFSLRFVIPLLFAISLSAYLVAVLIDEMTLKWFTRDLELRTRLITTTIQDVFVKPTNAEVKRTFERLIQDERLYALAYCSPDGQLSYATENFPTSVNCDLAPDEPLESHEMFRVNKTPLHFSFQPIMAGRKWRGHLVLAHDMSFVDRRSRDTKTYVFYTFVALAVMVIGMTVFIAQWSWRDWIYGLRRLIRGEGLFQFTNDGAAPKEFSPIVKDLKNLLRRIETERVSLDEDAITWSPKTLKDLLQRELAGDEILIVSNREPYIHNHKVDENGRRIEVQIPASGLVTALEPVMRACSGTWIAHGSGSADKLVVDKHDRVQVPPNDPSYYIRRLWLTPEEEQHYYYGFSNEGLWPLCHIAHTRPVFRAEDWDFYKRVNEKFADAVREEAKTDSPVVLVQDYHFALLPRMIRQSLPKATIITFWHIPWPNSEVFGICPWRDEILDGLLGSSIIGFHTRFHCNNFIDTVDKALECRIENETSTISYGGELTQVNPYPISIEWPVKWVQEQPSIEECHKQIRVANHLPLDMKVGVGVDRLDYTKGILERFGAIEKFFEQNPKWRGRMAFIQIAAPSRATIPQYQQFEQQVRAEAARINERFRANGFEPIVLRVAHHTPHEVYEYFRGADFCFVSSLHDGMNLVAKEFLAARDDELGVLILSQFTGAAHELPEALVVNPYDAEQCGRAILKALEMPFREQRDRMHFMRGLIQEFNVYRWAGRLLMDAARIRQKNRFMRRHGMDLQR